MFLRGSYTPDIPPKLHTWLRHNLGAGCDVRLALAGNLTAHGLLVSNKITNYRIMNSF